MNKRELIRFETEIKNLFLDAKIRSPIHLSKGNEEPLIEVFKVIGKNDWVFSTHRSHYHALLKGIPKDWLKQEILEGRSMHINSKEYKFVTSSIVGGCLPIALGVAMAIKRRGGNERVWCFVGDMCATTGVFFMCTRYASGYNLPIEFIVEDNGLSTNTPTMEVWGKPDSSPLDIATKHIYYYRYERGYPHISVGEFVEFR